MVLYLATSGNPLCWRRLFQYPAFWTTWKLCLSVLNFPSTRGGHLVLNISVWSTDSYSSTIVPIKQYAPSVLSWLALRRKALTSFSDNFAQGQVFLYLRLPRWNQICSGIPEPKQLDISITDYYHIRSLCLLTGKKKDIYWPTQCIWHNRSWNFVTNT